MPEETIYVSCPACLRIYTSTQVCPAHPEAPLTPPTRWVGIIVAISPERVIGVDGKIPWHYSADLKRFKKLTMGSTIIMGRKTWESIGSKPLAGRRNVVVTSQVLAGVECFGGLSEALSASQGRIWIIGGSQLYTEALRHADVVDVTHVPDRITATGDGVVYFPVLDPAEWEAWPAEDHDDPALRVRVFTRRR